MNEKTIIDRLRQLATCEFDGQTSNHIFSRELALEAADCIERLLAIRNAYKADTLEAEKLAKVVEAKTVDEAFRASPLYHKLGRLQEMISAIDELREEEGSSVLIPNDNPDFNNNPNCYVEVSGEWTKHEYRQFTGVGLADCLQKALAAKQEYNAAKLRYPPVVKRPASEIDSDGRTVVPMEERDLDAENEDACQHCTRQCLADLRRNHKAMNRQDSIYSRAVGEILSLDHLWRTWEGRARNLAVMVRRLVRAIHKYEIDVEDPMPGPCSRMLQQADDMLGLYDLRGSPLREEK